MSLNLITDKEIYDFIFKQPQDRPLEFTENTSEDNCGCVMVHYGLEVLKSLEFDHGRKRITAKTESILTRLYIISSTVGTGIHNYGQLQEHLRKHNISC